MDGLITLADLPELQGDDPSPRAEIAIARLDDKLKDPRYGRFAITQDDVSGWRKNLSDVFGGRVSIDEDHSSDRGKGTKAAAWIEGIRQQGKLVTASVQFTPEGARKVRDKEFLYISPTFVDDYVDEHGAHHGKALLGAALTNRPVLRKGMPTLSLSRDEFDGVATLRPAGRKQLARERKRARAKLLDLLAEENGSAASSDSRTSMDAKQLAKALDLPEDADSATILAKAQTVVDGAAATGEETAAAAPAPSKKTKKLGKGKKGKKGSRTMELSASEMAGLITAANAGQAAATQLAQERFENEWTRTLSEGRVAPAQEEQFRTLYAQDSELAIKTLAGMQRIVPTKPRGSGDGGSAQGPAPAGVDPARFALHQQALDRAKTLAREDSNLTPDEAYSRAAIELEEAADPNSNGDLF